MATTLRGHYGLTFESAVARLSAAAEQRLPRHVTGVPGQRHLIVCPAFVDWRARFFEITTRYDRATGWLTTSSEETHPGGLQRGHLFATGNGAAHVTTVHKQLMQRLVRRYDRGRMPARAVAVALAEINLSVHLKDPPYVGDRSIVVWRHRAGGGESAAFRGARPDESSWSIPTVGGGFDVGEIAREVTEVLRHRAANSDPYEVIAHLFDDGEVNERVERLPSHPDDRLP